MAAKPSIDDRLSRIEAIEAREADATDSGYEMRILRAWSTPDLRRLERLLERAESGDPSAALTASEQEWINETMEQAKVIADAPRDLAKRIVELEKASASETAGAGKLDLSWLSKDERRRLRTILLQVQGHISTQAGLNALTTADVAWLTELGSREPG